MSTANASTQASVVATCTLSCCRAVLRASKNEPNSAPTRLSQGHGAARSHQMTLRRSMRTASCSRSGSVGEQGGPRRHRCCAFHHAFRTFPRGTKATTGLISSYSAADRAQAGARPSSGCQPLAPRGGARARDGPARTPRAPRPNQASVQVRQVPSPHPPPLVADFLILLLLTAPAS